ncbi:MAG: primosomal protein N' [Tannerella sp.]|nr:primosomal protein N' [Tannerella sp.]
MNFAEVVLPLPLETFTYRIPAEMKVEVGSRVVVNLGRSHFHTGIVVEVHDRKPPYKTKDINACLDKHPVIRPPQVRFWKWIASYYLCKLGDVCHAALPSGFLPDGREWPFPEGSGYTPHYVTFVRIAENCRDEAKLSAVFDQLRRAPKQEAMLLRFLDLSHALNPADAREVSKKELQETDEATSSSVLDGLVKRGVLAYYRKAVPRGITPVCRTQPPHPLSDAQLAAHAAIIENFRTRDVCLLHGVTSSGKTELYIRLIADTLARGRQVLYLLPEIALTTQLTERLSKVFGEHLMVYHSKFSDAERVEIWNRLLRTEEPALVMGVRSSVFLPFHDLGLVVVDEEHENTYKQQEPAPRYQARNAAIVLASLHGGKVLLGSATPSIESYFNAKTGKYGLVELTSRYGDSRMPRMEVVDVRELRRKKIMRDTLFSPLLVKYIREALEKDEQVILFQNRRGFAPVVECKACGWTPRCPNCDVSLAYHRAHNRLECHYCGHIESLPSHCPSCGGADLQMYGFGTEKIEEEIGRLFPGAHTDRLDLDAVRSRMAYENILGDFAQGKTQILIGTQMLSKGLDFGKVSVVGILNADSLLNYPDFRAHERAFQLMVQVAGRAGRRERQGVVVVQTSQPGLPLIGMVCRGAYAEMAALQLAERKAFRYPPYYRLITTVFRGRQEEDVVEAAGIYAARLKEKLGERRVLGPVVPPVTRIQNLYLRQVILKLEASAALPPVWDVLAALRRDLQSLPAMKSLLLHYDVDP